MRAKRAPLRASEASTARLRLRLRLRLIRLIRLRIRLIRFKLRLICVRFLSFAAGFFVSSLPFWHFC